MKLLTKEIINKIPKLYSQENVEDPLCVVKFFDPSGGWTWYVIEGEEKADDFLFYGYVEGFEKELGYFTLNELLHAKDHATNPLRRLPIERDLYFTATRLSEIKRGY